MSLFRWYERRVFPWLNDRLTADPELERLRGEVLGAARGRVIEIGFGSGANLRHYPAGVESVTGIEPNEGMRERAALRMRASPIPVELIAAGAESLPFPARSFDTAVSTLTLCTVSDPARVLAELRRVLADEGRLIILEHGLSQDPGVARWQNRLDRIQGVVACGCHLNRPMIALVQDSGFRFESQRTFYAPKIPRTHGWITLGAASPAVETA